MDLAALTILFFGVLIAATDMTGLARPEILLHILGLSGGGTIQIFVMSSAQASLALGLYYILAAINNNRMFIQWTIPWRTINFAVFAGMVLLGSG